jgi:hypothetical protein
MPLNLSELSGVLMGCYALMCVNDDEEKFNARMDEYVEELEKSMDEPVIEGIPDEIANEKIIEPIKDLIQYWRGIRDE